MNASFDRQLHATNEIVWFSTWKLVFCLDRPLSRNLSSEIMLVSEMQLIWIIPEACVHSSLLSLFSVRIGDQSIVGVVDICGHMWTCYVGRPTFGEQPQVSSSRRFVFATCCSLKAICIQGMPSRRCCDGRTAAFLRNKPRDLLQLACNSSAIYPVTDTCISCTVV